MLTTAFEPSSEPQNRRFRLLSSKARARELKPRNTEVDSPAPCLTNLDVNAHEIPYLKMASREILLHAMLAELWADAAAVRHEGAAW